MTTGIYLEDHPPARSQFRAPRREKPSGLIVVHTAEGVMDTVGPDTGAENVAAFIARRTDPGSYHLLADSDTHLHLVRFRNEAYGDGTGSNPFAIHLSFACKTTDWAKMTPAKRAAFLKQGAIATVKAMKWLDREHDVTVPLVRVTREQSEARRPGFISHAERDPARRSDPGLSFPWKEFFAAIKAELGPPPPPPPAKTPNITAFRLATTRAEKRAAAEKIAANGSPKARAAALDWLDADTARALSAKTVIAQEVR